MKPASANACFPMATWCLEEIRARDTGGVGAPDVFALRNGMI
jgi:hypothetical protein